MTAEQGGDPACWTHLPGEGEAPSGDPSDRANALERLMEGAETEGAVPIAVALVRASGGSHPAVSARHLGSGTT